MEPTQSPESDRLESHGDDAGAGLGSTGPGGHAAGADLIIDELLVEEISIDGMCGVY